ncbi:hypothetical protein FOPG_07228 [Fusarium oxysporum f. sp. conglutinans race 2 54008]|uniref:Uncharacterized protein n=1 Tax=Fusarium oxysporum f. sp. conglutinans race 2 54008 TaxID=1089457 RepID=X0I4I0_FUSOX|nr:hypothetical protein FOPG_07228 [Fusarium oxysporum f. sp. conglutinans race 2 54008]
MWDSSDYCTSTCEDYPEDIPSYGDIGGIGFSSGIISKPSILNWTHFEKRARKNSPSIRTQSTTSLTTFFKKYLV